jgi:uncharacterized YccA/Bax inhibitor family protein
MRTSNPALSSKAFEGFAPYEAANAMTVEGAVKKTGMLLILCVGAAAVAWIQFEQAALAGNIGAVMPWIIGGAIGGFIIGIVTCFKREWSPFTAPLYALCEGLLLGGLSAYVNTMYQGIAFQAVCLTFGTLFGMLIVYQAGWVRATESFKMGVMAATGGICLVYLISMVLRLFGGEFPFIHQAGWIGIGFSLFVVVIAALNLVLDFDFIEQGAAHGAPKYMEWYAGFGLLMTLVWLYLEILRLLMKLNRR